MADLALGLAKSAVEGMLTMANTAIDEEKLLQKSVKCDLRLISEEFEMMHSFLSSAKEHTTNNMERTLERQVRNLALDVEDCIELVVLDKSSWWRRLLPSCVPAAAPVTALDDAATDMKMLRARVQDIGERSRRYGHIGDCSLKAPELVHQQAVANATELDILVVARNNAADESGQLDLLNSIRSNYGLRELQVISVWGTASNLGMASLVKEAYDEPEIYKNFGRRAWVKLMHPFNPHGFIYSLLIQFYTNCCPKQDCTVGAVKQMEAVEATEGGLIKELMKQVSNQRYLVVLEDISTMDVWDTIRAYLPDNRKGSCIIVHTQHLEIASFCIGHSYRVSELKRFSEEHSVCAFLKEVRGQDVPITKMKAAQIWFDKFQRACVGREISLHALDVQDEPTIKKKAAQIWCLIVIDDIRSVEEWDLIKAALALRGSESSLKSCIIVTTNEESVATSCATTTWNVKALEHDEIIDLIRKKVYENTGSSELKSAEVVEQAKHIIHKCGGLPKVIVAIADFLSTQRKDNSVDLEGWWRLTHSFMPELETNRAFGSLQGLFSWVYSYFLTCPDSLKPCIFYLSIFPVNHSIRRMRLVRRWIAEGYSRDDKQRTAMQAAEEFFSKLVKLCMIRMLGSVVLTSSFSIPLCQVNGFFHEYIVSRSMEENLVFTLEGSCSMNLQRTVRHLAIGRTWDRDKDVFKSIDFSRLRSLTVFGKWSSFFISDKMCLLRVLDLEDALGVTEKDLEQMVKMLPRLKFLSLKGCSHISCLPDSLGDLQQLQTLDIRDTFVIMLPKSIIKLQKLQFIRAGTTKPQFIHAGTTGMDQIQPQSSLSMPSMSRPQHNRTPVSWLPKFSISHRITGSSNYSCVKVPRGIGRLTALNSLGFIDVRAEMGGSTILEELKNLTLLHDLEVSGINRNNINKFLDAISGHRHLELLTVKFDTDNLGSMDGNVIISPLESLRALELYGLVRKLPVWMMQLQGITSIKLQMTMLPQEEIDAIERIPKLRFLSLFLEKFQDGKLKFGRPFTQLHALEIASNSMLHAVTFGYSAMRNLEVLNICCSSVPSMVFSGLENLGELKEVWLLGNYGDTLKQHVQRQLACHHKKIKPVLRVLSSS
ncbi:hypothetical protein U9M48_002390 [Paspalum notatum var. saurae]|uniref:Uncharacterized protein n=1 Tax=Paspalum notatum var. saurae TaxID=547442 RepID=A0AAQ3SJR9_PASNO